MDLTAFVDPDMLRHHKQRERELEADFLDRFLELFRLEIIFSSLRSSYQVSVGAHFEISFWSFGAGELRLLIIVVRGYCRLQGGGGGSPQVLLSPCKQVAWSWGVRVSPGFLARFRSDISGSGAAALSTAPSGGPGSPMCQASRREQSRLPGCAGSSCSWWPAR